MGSWEMRDAFVRLCDAVIPWLNGVCVLGGAQGRSQRSVCPHAVRFVLINSVLMLCFAGRVPSLQQMLVGERFCRYSCAQPQARGADVRGRCLRGLFVLWIYAAFCNERKQRVCLSSRAGLCWFVQTRMWRPAVPGRRGKAGGRAA